MPKSFHTRDPRRRRRHLLTLSASLLAFASPAAAQCPGWSADFDSPGISGNLNALLEHDDGSGPRLFAGGNSLRVRDVTSNLLAWDGTTWSSFGGGTSGPVEMLRTLDDGSGPALYVGGFFTHVGGIVVNRIGRWDGAAWSSLGTGVNGPIRDAVVHDDGTGGAIYVCGEFSEAGGVAVANVARWNGVSWSSVGQGFDARVEALAVFDDGFGPELVATGPFTGTPGLGLGRIAAWNGTDWRNIGTGGLSSIGSSLCVHDDGQGRALYVGGAFVTAGGVPSKLVARRRNGAWESVGLPLSNPSTGTVETLFEHDSGNGLELYAAGSFGGYAAPPFRIARWTGSAWADVGGGIGTGDTGGIVYSIAGFGAGASRELVVGGNFEQAGTSTAKNLASFDGTSWGPFVEGLGLNNWGSALTVHDDGNGPRLVATGYFRGAGGMQASRIASFDGSAWSALGAGFGPDSDSPFPHCVCSFDDGGGPELYVGGQFSRAGGVPVANIAKHDGSTWSALGAGILGGDVIAIQEYDEGTGPVLFAGGNFSNAGGIGIGRIARWDGANWSAVGGVTFTGTVWSMTVFDAGAGLELFVGGRFAMSGNPGPERLAAWNGTTWRTVGFGQAANFNESVFDLRAWHDGTRERLYAGGRYALAAGIPCSNVASYDGTTWSALGAGVAGTVFGLSPLDGANGRGLCVGGEFVSASGVPVSNVARWDGAAWSSLGPHTNDGIVTVRDLATFDSEDGNGPKLYAIGNFASLGGQPSSHIAAYSDCGAAGRVLCAGDGSGTACPCGNASAPGVGTGCVNSHASGGTLRARGYASLAHDTLVLAGTSMTNGAALYIQGTQAIGTGAGSVFGDGLRCAGGSVVRLDIVSNAGGASAYPSAGDPSVSTKGLVAASGTRVYQVWYRDAAAFCTSSTFNLSNAIEIVWQR